MVKILAPTKMYFPTLGGPTIRKKKFDGVAQIKVA